MAAKFGRGIAQTANQAATNVMEFLGDPRPQYVPLADVSFGPPNIIMPHSLPSPNQVFQAPIFNKMQIPVPSIGTIYDEKRNGASF